MAGNSTRDAPSRQIDQKTRYAISFICIKAQIGLV
jgi:hypothetical protein